MFASPFGEKAPLHERSEVMEPCICFLFYSCDFCYFFKGFCGFNNIFLVQLRKEWNSETIGKCENICGTICVIKGKVSASTIRLSGATQSPAHPFNLTSSDWETDEKSVLASLRTREANRLIPPWNKCPLFPPISNISSRAK